MTVKTPIRTVFNESNVATGLAEYQTGEFIGVEHGGTGAVTLTSNAILLGNGTSAVQNSAIGISGTTLSSTDSTLITIAEGLSVTGALNVTGTITGSVTGTITGNADTATTLETARNIAGQSFDGSANITIAATDLSDTDQSLSTTDNVTFNDLTVSGNLTVSGTTTTVNTETINLADNTITLNSNATGSATENGGIEIERGDDTNKTLLWNETSDKWTVGSETFVAATFEGTATGLATSFTTGLTADTSPADDDLLIVYDTSAGVYKKVAKSNIGTSGGGGGGLTGALDFTLKDGTEDD